MNHDETPPTHTRRFALAFGMILVATMGPRSWSQEPYVTTQREGYLFIDGQYIQPPYTILAADDWITINGKELAKDYFDLADFEQDHVTHRPGKRGHKTFNPLATMARKLKAAKMGVIVVLFRQVSPLVLHPSGGGDQLLNVLVGRANAEIDPPVNLARPDRVSWARLVHDFKPDDGFLARVTNEMEAAENASLEGDRTTAENQMVAQISFPLTSFAMMTIVLGFGHLLSSQPIRNSELGVAEFRDPQTIEKYTRKTLAIIALLSIIDLAWTIAATNAGTMRELNPLGSQLINDPTRLVVFKLTVTGLSIGILYALQLKQSAQVASWWCCLILVLLTARWVIFQSMFL